MPSWRSEPRAIAGEWSCFRQVATQTPPLYHDAGAPARTQESGRWHRRGEDCAQYLSLSALGAWAECARYFDLRSPAQAREMRRDLWLVFVRETQIADLATFEDYEACGLDPEIAVGDHDRCQTLADELRAAGFRGLLSPCAALAGAVNLTLFGERYEAIVDGDPGAWHNPHPDVWLPVQLVAAGAPVPDVICRDVVLGSDEHPGYRDWRAGSR